MRTQRRLSANQQIILKRQRCMEHTTDGGAAEEKYAREPGEHRAYVAGAAEEHIHDPRAWRV